MVIISYCISIMNRLHQLKQTLRQNIDNSTDKSEFILNDYRKVSKNYSLKEIVNVLAIIKDYDGKSKGYKKDKYFDSELLQFISEIKT